MSSVRSFSKVVPHIAPESWPPWPGSSTTRVNGAGAALRRTEVAGRGIERICHQANDATITANPSPATMFFMVAPTPIRQDIAIFEDSSAIVRPEDFGSELRFLRRVRARLLQLRHWSIAHLDICES